MDEWVRSTDRLLVKQIKEWGEILVGFESANRFEILDDNGDALGYAAEEGGGLGTVLLRNFFGRCRACKIHIFDAQGDEVGLGDKPFRFFFHRMEIYDHGEKIGAIQRRFSILHRKFTMEDEKGNEILEILSPLFRIWTFKLHRDGVEVGRISKKWAGLLKEAFTDADVFGVEFSHPELPVQIRKLLLVAVFLIDFTCFEDNTNRRGAWG